MCILEQLKEEIKNHNYNNVDTLFQIIDDLQKRINYLEEENLDLISDFENLVNFESL